MTTSAQHVTPIENIFITFLIVFKLLSICVLTFKSIGNSSLPRKKYGAIFIGI